MKKTYTGRRNGCGPGQVTVRVEADDGGVREYPLPHHVRHSPDGFNWGYGGSGPSDLARCILIDAAKDILTDDQDRGTIVEEHYQAFKFDVIAGFKADQIEIGLTAVEVWLKARMNLSRLRQEM